MEELSDSFVKFAVLHSYQKEEFEEMTLEQFREKNKQKHGRLSQIGWQLQWEQDEQNRKKSLADLKQKFFEFQFQQALDNADPKAQNEEQKSQGFTELLQSQSEDDELSEQSCEDSDQQKADQFDPDKPPFEQDDYPGQEQAYEFINENNCFGSQKFKYDIQNYKHEDQNWEKRVKKKPILSKPGLIMRSNLEALDRAKKKQLDKFLGGDYDFEVEKKRLQDEKKKQEYEERIKRKERVLKEMKEYQKATYLEGEKELAEHYKKLKSKLDKKFENLMVEVSDDSVDFPSKETRKALKALEELIYEFNIDYDQRHIDEEIDKYYLKLRETKASKKKSIHHIKLGFIHKQNLKYIKRAKSKMINLYMKEDEEFKQFSDINKHKFHSRSIEDSQSDYSQEFHEIAKEHGGHIETIEEKKQKLKVPEGYQIKSSEIEADVKILNKKQKKKVIEKEPSIEEIIDEKGQKAQIKLKEIIKLENQEAKRIKHKQKLEEKHNKVKDKHAKKEEHLKNLKNQQEQKQQEQIKINQLKEIERQQAVKEQQAVRDKKVDIKQKQMEQANKQMAQEFEQKALVQKETQIQKQKEIQIQIQNQNSNQIQKDPNNQSRQNNLNTQQTATNTTNNQIKNQNNLNNLTIQQIQKPALQNNKKINKKSVFSEEQNQLFKKVQLEQSQEILKFIQKEKQLEAQREQTISQAENEKVKEQLKEKFCQERAISQQKLINLAEKHEQSLQQLVNEFKDQNSKSKKKNKI